VDFAAFLGTAQRGELPPVVLVHGADAQFVDDALAAATAGLFPDPSLLSLGREVLDARELTATDVVRSAMTLPLMTSARLVAVRHVQELKPSPVMTEYLANPNPSTRLLLLADESLEASRERKRHWLLDAAPRGAIVAPPVRRDRALADWLRQRAGAEGLQVSDEAAKLLVEWVGEDTAALLNETRKAALAGASGARTVGVKDVTAIVGEHRMAGVFDLTRAIERREVGAALRLLDRLLTTDEPMRLHALLTGEVRMTWRVKELLARGQSAEQIARTLGRPPGVIAGRQAAATATSTEALARKLRRCWDVERRLKSGGEPHAELAALIVELASEGAGTSVARR